MGHLKGFAGEAQRGGGNGHVNHLGVSDIRI